jgi:hypothetical protein
MCLLERADPQNARLARVRLYAGLKVSADGGNVLEHARAAGLKQDARRCGGNPPNPFIKGGEEMGFVKADINKK